MLFASFKVGKKEFKLRIGAAAIVDLENKLGGRNPLQVLMTLESEGKLPPVNELLVILHASLQKFHHGFTINDVYDLYDEYVETGNSYMELISAMIETFKVSGFFKAASQATATQPIGVSNLAK